MVRRLSRTLGSILLLMPAATYALGLGDIRLHSALGQRLDAEIELLSVSPDEAESIDVALASRQAFATAGIDRPAVLMFLQFAVEQTQDGEYYIDVTSRRPIREPFLDFLLELSWRSGRLVREYTVLLDPPGLAPGASAPTVSAPEAEPAPTGTGTAPSRATTATGRYPLEYGPVKKDDTLWSIAERLRPNQSVSVQQMMVALLEANPEAFIDNNMNRLKAGYILRIDDPELLSAMSQAQAVREVTRQSRRWRDQRQQAAEQAPERRTPPGEEQPAPAVGAREEEQRLKLVTPTQEEREGAGEPAAAPETMGGAGEPGDLDAMRQELLLALEASEAQERENEELRRRLRELEGQLASMQRLLELKDEDMAALQQQGGAESGAEAEAPAPGTEEPTAEPEVPEPGGQVAAPAEKPAAEPEAPVQEKPAPKPKATPAPPPPQPSFIESLLGNTMVLVGGATLLVLLLAVAVIMIRRRKAGQFQESILTAGGTSSMLAGGKGAEGGASEETSLFSDLSISDMNSIQADDSEVDPLTEADVYMAYGRYQQAEELLRQALEANGGRAELHTKLLELFYNTNNAEGFRAHVEEQRELLQSDANQWDRVLRMGHELMPDEPLFAEAPEEAGEGGETAAEPKKPSVEEDVLDIGLDLDALAEEMESDVGGESDDFDLGVDLSEFETGGEKAEKKPAGGETEESAAGGEATAEPEQDLDFDIGDFGAGEPEAEDQEKQPSSEAAAGEEEQSPESFDFDLGLDTEESPEAKSGEAAPEPQAADEQAAAEPETKADEDEDAGLEFDLGDFELPREDEDATAKPAAESDDEDKGLDFDLGDFSLPEEESASAETGQMPEPEPAADKESGADKLEFDLEGLGEEQEASAKPDTTEAAAAEDEEFDLDKFAASLDEEAPEEAASNESAQDDETLGAVDFDDEMFSDLDEVGTKLDLARAYVDMEDTDGARSILNEVLEEGNDEQKQQAQALLDKLP